MIQLGIDRAVSHSVCTEDNFGATDRKRYARRPDGVHLYLYGEANLSLVFFKRPDGYSRPTVDAAFMRCRLQPTSTFTADETDDNACLRSTLQMQGQEYNSRKVFCSEVDASRSEERLMATIDMYADCGMNDIPVVN